MKFLFLFMTLFLLSCTHDTQSVRVYHYGTNDSGNGNGVHTVHVGDTLWSLSQRYNLPMKDLMELNRVYPPYKLEKGQRLILPVPKTYEVQTGDTLYSISRVFKISMTDLSHLNHLETPYTIQKGQILQVPSSVSYGDVVKTAYDGKTYVPKERQLQAIDQADGQKIPERKPVYTERKSIAKVREITPDPRSSSRFMTPVRGEVISSFGAKKDSLHNDGMNIKAPRGTSIRAAENGIIVYADSELEGYGKLILVKHADRYVTAYAHMDKMLAKKGQRIRRGEVIGTVGSTGSVKVPQLHFEIRKGVKTLNPKKYIGS